MLLQVNEEVIEVGFEKGKYIRRHEDDHYLCANDTDSLIDWALLKHTVWFEFNIEPKTFYLKSHCDCYVIWDSENKCLKQVSEPHELAIQMIQTEKPTRTFARTFDPPNQLKTEASHLMKAVHFFYKSMDPIISESHPDLKTKKERKTYMGTLWRSFTKEEKHSWVNKMKEN